MPRMTIALIALLFFAGIGVADRDRVRERDSASDDTQLVAQTRKKLTTSVDVEWKDTSLRECLTELGAMLDVKFYYAPGVSRNIAITYSANDKRGKDILHEIFKQRGLGYIIHRKANDGDRYEGWIQVLQGDHRGDEPPKRVMPTAKD
jgi:hypothetical protein